MCNCRHPGPRCVWEVGSEPQFLAPLPWPPRLRGCGGEFQKRRCCCYTRDFRARDLPRHFRVVRRLRTSYVSRRSRVGESTARTTFDGKTHMIWKTFFRDFAGRSQTPCFYNELSASRRPSFRNFGSQLAKSTSGPRTAQRRLREVPGEPGEGLEELCESSGGPYI